MGGSAKESWYENGESLSVKKIKRKHGGIPAFIQKAKKWIESVPREHIEAHGDLKAIADKNVDWSDPTILAIVNRRFTSLDHAKWINSVLERMDRIERHVKRKCVGAQFIDDISALPLDPEKRLEKSKESALDFISSVRGYVYQNLDVTEKQLQALNDIYKRFDNDLISP